MPNSNNEKITRKLRAILSADVKGYSLLMADDEVLTLKTLNEYRDIMSKLIRSHAGRVVDAVGDNLLAEFSSAVNAVECAIDIQKNLKKENSRFVADRKLKFRIGINIGDVIHEGDRIIGEGVNIAARIEGLADAGGVCISRNTFDHIKNKLQLETEYLGEHEVKNIKDPVRVYKILIGTDAPKPLVEEHLELPDKPSIAVLPFTNMSGDPSQEYFSDGLTEQIINGLCKVSNLFVIGRNSSFAYKGKTITTKQIAKELGVRYILEGSVQRAGVRVRITAQLIDATTDYHMWSENYDRDLEDIFALQDEITMKMIGVMQVQLTLGKQAHTWGVKTNIQAFDKCMRGLEHGYKTTKRDNIQARHLFAEAIHFDDKYALPYVFTGLSYIVDLALGWAKSPLQSFEDAERYVERAIDLSDSFDLAHAILGFIHLYKRQYEDAIREGYRALELNPNGAESRALLAFTMIYIGETKKAIKLIKGALRLNPIPPAFYYTWLSQAFEKDGQYESAIEQAKKAIEINPKLYGSYFPLIASLMRLNQTGEARTYANELLKIAPKFSLNFFRSVEPYKDREIAEKHIDILYKAGLPD